MGCRISTPQAITRSQDCGDTVIAKYHHLRACLILCSEDSTPGATSGGVARPKDIESDLDLGSITSTLQVFECHHTRTWHPRGSYKYFRGRFEPIHGFRCSEIYTWAIEH